MTPTQRSNFRRARQKVRFLPLQHRLRLYAALRGGIFGFAPSLAAAILIDSWAQANVEGRK